MQFPVLVCFVLSSTAAETINCPSKLPKKFQIIAVTSANWPVVTPGSQCICHSLTSDALRTLQHIIVFTGKLYTRTDPRRKRGERQKELNIFNYQSPQTNGNIDNVSRSKQRNSGTKLYSNIVFIKNNVYSREKAYYSVHLPFKEYKTIVTLSLFIYSMSSVTI